MIDALIAAATLLAAGVQATTGVGFAMILAPVLLVALSPEAAIVLVTALALALNLLVLFSERRRPSVAWREIGPILLAAVPGSLLGLLLLRALPRPALQVAVGAIVVAFALRAVLAAPSRETSGDGRRGRLAVGLLVGALHTSIGVSGPPIALWLSRRSIVFAQVRDSLSAAFVGLGVITALTLVPVLGGVRLHAAAVAAALGAVLAGHAIGSRLHRRLSTARLEWLLAVVVLASGASALAFGLAGV